MKNEEVTRLCSRQMCKYIARLSVYKCADHVRKSGALDGHNCLLRVADNVRMEEQSPEEAIGETL
jgi:hypothetical protein